MDLKVIDWKSLEQLRAAFLDGTAGRSDYWRSESDLAVYDATFAQRIGWKWDYVLNELTRRGWTPPAGDVLDWGCGSGVAHRVFLDHFGTMDRARLWVWDRSALATAYAGRRARERFGHVEPIAGLPESAAVILLSHVLTELDDPALEEVIGLIRRATAVIWIEPGTFAASRALIAVRERMRGELNVVAPCTHQVECGMLATENAPHWCHHFAEPPPGIFTDSGWMRFGKLAGIDLRSLPLSFLVLDRRPPPPVPEGAVRVIGRARVYKAHAQLLGCDACGVRECRLSRRNLADTFRRLKKGECDPLQVWERSHGEIIGVRSW